MTTLRRIIIIVNVILLLIQIDCSCGFECPSPEQRDRRRAEIRAKRRASLRYRTFDLGPPRKNCGRRCLSGDDQYLDWLLAKKSYVDPDMKYGLFPLRLRQQKEAMAKKRNQHGEL